ncbi:MAG TPA: glycosyltransferase, partial [Gemmatimonadaceae bacterium]|nr:glycosyltransferase [Gemmatimonadaceae bacterium]
MVIVFWVGVGLWAYAYAGYPALLALLPRRAVPQSPPHTDWPLLTITVPVHNEASVIADTLDALIAVDYPPDRRHILVVSDASTDGTDAIVQRYAGQGVALFRLPERRGKTAAENAARALLHGDIVINTDASVRVDPAAIKALVRALDDPTVGVASGRDVSVSRTTASGNAGESTYVGYEMLVRDLETRAGGIVGASGCLYAIRRALHALPVPEALSRDFSSALNARLHGFRAVSVPSALCYVPRGATLRQEYRRKVRTMARGLGTLWHRRALLDPLRYGGFAWMLASHKLVRWLLPWASVAMVVALALLAYRVRLAQAALAGV